MLNANKILMMSFFSISQKKNNGKFDTIKFVNIINLFKKQVYQRYAQDIGKKNNDKFDMIKFVNMINLLKQQVYQRYAQTK